MATSREHPASTDCHLSERAANESIPALAICATRLPNLPLGLFWIFLMIASTGCAGYNLGNQYLFRNDIHTVHVPIFESESNRRFLGQRLTEAVVKRVEESTPLTITDSSVANSFLRGRLVREQKTVVTENRFDEGRAVRTAFRVEVDWVDRAGVPLMPRRSVIIDHSVDFIPEGGQSMATAQQEVIDRIAREIVGQMEMPW